jgi:hypothetical protein
MFISCIIQRMRKIKVRDKDMNEKGVLTANDIDGEISFSVTENGF